MGLENLLRKTQILLEFFEIMYFTYENLLMKCSNS